MQYNCFAFILKATANFFLSNLYMSVLACLHTIMALLVQPSKQSQFLMWLLGKINCPSWLNVYLCKWQIIIKCVVIMVFFLHHYLVTGKNPRYLSWRSVTVLSIPRLNDPLLLSKFTHLYWLKYSMVAFTFKFHITIALNRILTVQGPKSIIFKATSMSHYFLKKTFWSN